MEEQYGSESGEADFINPWEDLAEDGEEEMDYGDESGEFDMQDMMGEEGEEEMEDEEGEAEEHDMEAIINSNKEMKDLMKDLK